MTNPNNLTEQELATPLGAAFQRIVTDLDFAATVADASTDVLAEMGIPVEHHDAIAHDAALVVAAAPEVVGFGHNTPVLLNVLYNNENITGILVNNENVTGALCNNEVIEFMTPGRLRMPGI